MPSLGDSVFIFMLALMLLGPKKLPQLARQLGKLMAEFRKASNDFRMQMEDELRIEDQKDHQRKVDALAPPPSTVPDPTIPTEDPSHPHLPAVTENTIAPPDLPAPTPIAESGSLRMMPPSTGLPVESSARRSPFASSNTGRDGHGTPDNLSTNHDSGTGISSEEPGEAFPETTALDVAAYTPDATPYEPPPDRSRPAMIGEGEHATHA